MDFIRRAECHYFTNEEAKFRTDIFIKNIILTKKTFCLNNWLLTE